MSKKTKAGRSCACHREREATAAAQAVVVRLASCVRALVSSCACPENDRPCADFMRHDRCVTVASLLAIAPADALATYVAERLASADAAEEEACTDDGGKPLVCVECKDVMRVGEGGWTQFADGLRHAYVCEGRYWRRERDTWQARAEAMLAAALRAADDCRRPPGKDAAAYVARAVGRAFNGEKAGT